jgi:histidine triad (HIT) family protein
MDMREFAQLSVVEQLKLLRAPEILIRAADAGYFNEVRCKMPVCFYPESKTPKDYYPDPNPDADGRWMFDKNPVKGDLTEWNINREHYPIPRHAKGGNGIDNAQPAHVLCNNLDDKRNPRFARERARRVEYNKRWSKKHAEKLAVLAGADEEWASRAPTDCTFCAIAGGTGPPHELVAENPLAVAFMNANPAALGHVLVIPRTHAGTIWELDVDDGAAVWELTHRVALASDLAFSPDGLNLFQANGAAGWQSEPHFHIHVVPRWYGDPLVPNWKEPQGLREDIPHAAARLRSVL